MSFSYPDPFRSAIRGAIVFIFHQNNLSGASCAWLLKRCCTQPTGDGFCREPPTRKHPETGYSIRMACATGNDGCIKSGNSAPDALHFGWNFGGGLIWLECRRDFRAGFRKKRGVPRLHGSHATWELLSPDLRCFCN